MKTCLTETELYDYLGEPFEVQGKYHQTFEFGGYAWYIDDLKIYDKPKILQNFFKPCDGCDKLNTDRCTNEISYCRAKTITRPPQSWCYVEGE